MIPILACLALLLAAPAAGAEDVTDPPPQESRLALVLSGGGARGAAHIGVLKVLEELHIVPDLIVGTSMGSIVGGLYAAGYSPEEIEAILGTIGWNSIFLDKLPREDLTFHRKQDDTPWFIPFKLRFAEGKPYLPAGVLGGQELEFFLRRLVARATSVHDFDDLPIPFRAVAMDFATSDAVVLGSGNLVDAMRASMSVPGLLAPVVLDGRALVDGGSVANLPIGIARELGADRVIAVDISTPLEPEQKDRSFLEVMAHLTDILTAGSVQADLKLLREGDVLIRPELGDITFRSFDRVTEAVAIGTEAARAMAEQLGRFAATPERWAESGRVHVRNDVTRLPVGSVEIDHTGWVDDRIVQRRISVPVGEPLDQDDLLRQLARLRGLEYFGMMSYDLEDGGATSHLKIDIEPRRTGRANLQFGTSLRTDFDGDLTYAFLLRHQWLALNRRAAEWVNTMQIGERALLRTEFLQPLDWGLRWYVKPALDLAQVNQSVWFDAMQVAEYQVNTVEAAADIGRFLGNWGNLFATLYRGEQKGEVQIGLPQFPRFDEDAGGFRLGFDVDTRDLALFPRKGTSLRIQVERNLEALGSSRTWTVADLRWRQFFSVGRGTLSPRLEARTNVNESATFASAAFVGGFQRLSGLGDYELAGDRGGVVALDYHYELLGLDLGALSTRLFAGVTLEAGNTYFQDDSITWPSLRTGAAVYVGAATPIGPVYLGGGWTDPDRTRFYLILGAQY